jgi:uncharacterized cupin superfamily protein
MPAPAHRARRGRARKFARSATLSALMEPYPGVFVSRVSAGTWEPDPEVGGEMHVLCNADGAESGLSRCTKPTEPIRWTLPAGETILILEGAARIEVDKGSVLELTAGIWRPCQRAHGRPGI